MSQNDFVEIDISKIDVNETNKYHFRKLIKQDTVDAIVESLEHGQLYQPIIVTELEDGKYQVIDGEHRLLAHRKLDKEQIMALIIPERDAVIWGIKANILRSDYNSMEKSNALQRLLDIRKENADDSEGYTQNELAKEIGLSKGTVSDYLGLQNLPEEIKKNAEQDGYSSIVTLRSIARSKASEEKKIELYKEKAAKAKLVFQKNEDSQADSAKEVEEMRTKKEHERRSRLYRKIESQKASITTIATTISEITSTIKEEEKNAKNQDDFETLIQGLESAANDLLAEISSLKDMFTNKR